MRPCSLWIGLFLTLTELLSASGMQETQLAGAVHVHSRFSNGRHTIDELARLAEEKGLDVLLLSDSFLTTVDYGFKPLDRVAIDGINRQRRQSVLDHGLEAYFAAVAEAARAHPNLVILPGVEAAPYYRWSGRPWNDLSLHEFDRHLQIYGLTSDELVDLPVIGNETWGNTSWDPALVGSPLLLLLLALLLVFRSLRRTVGLRHPRLPKWWRHWAALGVLLTASVLVAVFNYPFGRLWDPYGPDPGTEPYQRVIDQVADQGGAVFWSYPEARYGDVVRSGARMVSAPHPDDLLQTDGYHGFEGLYGDEITAVLPGRHWDRALSQYLAGQRRRAPFVLTGIDFHQLRSNGNPWYDLDAGQTIFLTAEKSPAAVLAALKQGRLYATFQAPQEKVRLWEFRIRCSDGSWVGQGQECAVDSKSEIRIRLDWLSDPPARGGVVFNVSLIQDGVLLETRQESLPFEWIVRPQLAPARHYFRLDVTSGRDYRILSNPIFVFSDSK